MKYKYASQKTIGIWVPVDAVLQCQNEIFCKSGSFQKSWLKGYTSLAAYLLLVYLVTALVPSLTACFESSPGRCSLTAVWISRLEMVCFLL